LLAGEPLLFDCDHLRLVNLVDGRAVMPWQSVRAGVHARRQHHHLRHTVGVHPQQCLVEKPGADDDRRRGLPGLRAGFGKQSSALVTGQPFGERIVEKCVIASGFLGAHRRDE
jgi:hypothetical protein